MAEYKLKPFLQNPVLSSIIMIKSTLFNHHIVSKPILLIEDPVALPKKRKVLLVISPLLSSNS